MLHRAVTFFAIVCTLSNAEPRRLLQAQFPASPSAPAGTVPIGGGGAVTPVMTFPPVIAFIPTGAAGGAGGPLQKLTCKDPCVTSANCPSECAQITKTIESPPNSFTLECSAMGSCAGSEIMLDYPAGGVKKFVNSIKVGAPYALYGSLVTINNNQAQGIKVVTIECQTTLGQGNCAMASFVFNNAWFGDLKCDEYIGCGDGCTVTSGGQPPVSCDSVSTT